MGSCFRSSCHRAKFVIFFFAVFSTLALSKGKTPVSFVGVDSDFDQNETLVNMKFSKRVPFSRTEVQDHGTFLHIELPEILVIDSGKFFESNGPYISKIAAFQFSPERSAIRMFVKKDAALLKKAVSLDILNDRLILSLDHKILEKSGLSDHLQKREVPKAVDIVKDTVVRKNISDPAAQVGMVVAESDTGSILEEKAGTVAAFLGFLLFAALVIMVLNRKIRSSKVFGNTADSAIMKSLATYPLSPKKNLTLMQIGGQKILLGVSPENISFLTNIEDKSQVVPPDSASAMRRKDPSSFQQLLAGQQGMNAKKKSQTSGTKSQASQPSRRGKKAPARNQVVAEVPEKDIALQDVQSLIRKKLRDLPRI